MCSSFSPSPAWLRDGSSVPTASTSTLCTRSVAPSAPRPFVGLAMSAPLLPATCARHLARAASPPQASAAAMYTVPIMRTAAMRCSRTCRRIRVARR